MNFGIVAEERGVEVQRAVVVTNLVVHPLRTVVAERRFVRRPSGEEQEQAGMMFVYEVYLFHTMIVVCYTFVSLRGMSFISSSVRAAVSEKRMRDVPSGTVGGRTGRA